MGARGTRTFENDDAIEWLAELERSGDDALPGALTPVAEAPEEAFVEAAGAARTPATAEIVASAAGVAPDELPGRAFEWIATRGVPEPALVELALRAAKRVCNGSKLKDLRDEAGEQAWTLAARDLRYRLGDIAAT
jgi:uncharacterized protein DUF4259